MSKETKFFDADDDIFDDPDGKNAEIFHVTYIRDKFREVVSKYFASKADNAANARSAAQIMELWNMTMRHLYLWDDNGKVKENHRYNQVRMLSDAELEQRDRMYYFGESNNE
jgi:hypothetical protein